MEEKKEKGKVVEKIAHNPISERIAKLIDVKTIITLTIIAGVTYGFLKGTVQGETYCAFAGTIIAFYFTKKEA